MAELWSCSSLWWSIETIMLMTNDWCLSKPVRTVAKRRILYSRTVSWKHWVIVTYWWGKREENIKSTNVSKQFYRRDESRCYLDRYILMYACFCSNPSASIFQYGVRQRSAMPDFKILGFRVVSFVISYLVPCSLLQHTEFYQHYILLKYGDMFIFISPQNGSI